jgi:hypothetical protein
MKKKTIDNGLFVERAWTLLLEAHPELVREISNAYLAPIEAAFPETEYKQFETMMKVVAISVANYFDNDFEHSATDDVTLN